MKLTKEECKGIIQVVANWGTYKQYLTIKELVNEHFDNECKQCESKFLKGISDVEKENDKLRIALDKACKILDECVIESDWKEQLLNDSN